MDGAQNIMLIGGPGTGKTHAPAALGIQAIEASLRKVRFFFTIALVNVLKQERTRGKAAQIVQRLTKLDLVILGKPGCLRQGILLGNLAPPTVICWL